MLLTCLFFPTRADNLPLVLQESMACGTPMVSFKVGGVPDLVRPGITGYLATPEDVKDFCNGATPGRSKFTRWVNNVARSPLMNTSTTTGWRYVIPSNTAKLERDDQHHYTSLQW